MILKIFFLSELFAVVCLAASISTPRSMSEIRSDVIVTKFGKDDDPKEPGWMRRQLMRFGEMASRVGNVMGSHAVKITSAVDKVCEIVKTVIPLLAAVCHVGQFGFCSATNTAPSELSSALSPSSLDLNMPD